MGKHCWHGFCRSDSRNVDQDEEVFFLRFPKIKNNLDQCVRWILACGREDVTFARVSKDAYICSKHFVGGRGPTEEFPDPLPVSEADFVAASMNKKQSKKRVCRPLELANRMFGEQYGEQVLMGKISCAGLFQESNQLLQQGDQATEDQSGFEDSQGGLEINQQSHPNIHQMYTTGVPDVKAETLPSPSTQTNQPAESHPVPDFQSPVPVEFAHHGQPSLLATASISGVTESSSMNTLSASPNSILDFPVANEFGKMLSQTPSAIRMRKYRQKMMKDQEKYEKIKATDRERKRTREAKQTWTDEKKARARAFARERTRRCRIRKKMQALGQRASNNAATIIEANDQDLLGVASRAISSMTRSHQQDTLMLQIPPPTPAPVRETTTPYQPLMHYPPTAVLSGSHASVHFHQASRVANSAVVPGISTDHQGMVGSDQCGMMGSEQQGMMGSEQRGMMGSEQQGMMGNENIAVASMQQESLQSSTTDTDDLSSNVPKDVFMWAGPEMVSKETNTESPALPKTSNKACQINTNHQIQAQGSQVSVSEASSQTDLMLNDLAMYSADDNGKDDGRVRREFIVQDVVRDDQTCSFYTGFSLIMVAWLFDLLKGSVQKHRTRAATKSEEPSSGVNLFEEFLLVLVWLQQGLHTDILAHWFGVSCNTVHAVCQTWLDVMIEELPMLEIANGKETATASGEVLVVDECLVSDEGSSSGKESSAVGDSGMPASNMPTFSVNLIFQRTNRFKFSASNKAYVSHHVEAFYDIPKTSRFGGCTTSNCSKFTYLMSSSHSRKASSKTQSKSYIGKSKTTGKLKRKADEPLTILDSPRGKKLCQRTRKLSREQHIFKTNVMNELEKFKVLQTIYPYSQASLLEDALTVSVLLAKFIVKDIKCP